MFQLHPQLQADCVILGHFPLCELLLMNDARYPWFILVPRRPGVREIYELTASDLHALMEESVLLSRHLVSVYRPDKMNIAALGNKVDQLHLHHIARYRRDPAWPAPVWGHGSAVPYSPEDIEAVRAKVVSGLGRDLLAT